MIVINNVNGHRSVAFIIAIINITEPFNRDKGPSLLIKPSVGKRRRISINQSWYGPSDFKRMAYGKDPSLPPTLFHYSNPTEMNSQFWKGRR